MAIREDKVVIFWFRRDLRLHDNIGLQNALKERHPVLPIFIFDDEITNELPQNDHRISFIYSHLDKINKQLKEKGTSLLCLKGKVEAVWKKLLDYFQIQAVFTNKDYEPYTIKRDKKIEALLNSKSIELKAFKDHVIFEENEVVKKDNTPYTVYTPYKNQWLSKLNAQNTITNKYEINNFLKINKPFPSLSSLNFSQSALKSKPFDISNLTDYEINRNIPSIAGTSNLSPHLRFGTISIREIVLKVRENQSFLNELIWREFFIQILFHYPKVVNSNFKSKYNAIEWRNNEVEFEKWKAGKTGYPIVDAGMRELNQTGYMHNRVRMITAGFLCKHLLINWQWGEAYFAQKLFDFELASNNGNWQWSAGTGCDSAPYFRIFNPTEQVKKFDPQLKYIKKWVPEFNSFNYCQPIVEHKFARERALSTYKKGIRS